MAAGRTSTTRRRTSAARRTVSVLPGALALAAMFLLAPSAARGQSPLPPPSTVGPASTAPAAAPLLQPLSPEEAAVFPFVPPLGVLDAIDLSRRLRDQLRTGLAETPINDKRHAQCRRAIDELLLFMMLEDEWHASLDDYTWYLAGRLRLSSAGPERLTLRLDPPIDGAQAIAVRAEGGRLLVEDLAGADADGAELDFTERTLYLRRDVPRRRVSYLARPARLREVAVTLSTDQPPADERATVDAVVFVGVSSVPEYGKSAVRLLRHARAAIEDFRFRDAIALLEEADREMLAFHRLDSPDRTPRDD